MQRRALANVFVRRAGTRMVIAATLLVPVMAPVFPGAPTALGSLAFAMETNLGVAIAPLGDLAPPSPPMFTSIEASDPGCAVATWIPSGDPTVMGYVVDYGTHSVHEGGAPQYEHSMEVGTTGSASVCFLPLGTHYVAVRAKNIAGMLSTHSAERSVVIMHAAVLISRFDARAEADGVRLEWRVAAGEAVRGFRVYRGAAGELQRVLTDLPGEATSFVDAGAVAGVAYTYVLAAVKEKGEEVRSIPVVVAVASSRPAPISAYGRQKAPLPQAPR